MNRLLGILLAMSLVVSCGPIIEVKIVKNPKPLEKPGNDEPRDVSLHEKSLDETRAGTKSFVINAIIDSDFATAIGLGDNACVQVVELSDTEVVADFADIACPDASGLLLAENIKFTLRYIEPDSGFNFLVILDDEEKAFGIAKVDPGSQSITLMSLCTEDYEDSCDLTLKEGGFDTFTPL